MTQSAAAQKGSQPGAASGPTIVQENIIRRLIRATEVDTRMLGMIGALIVIWVGFHLYGAIVNGYGAFLTVRNLWNLSVQTSSIAIMATGMVLIIVTRHIDLSVGSMLGFTAMIMAVIQTWGLPSILGIGHPAIWIITVICGLALGTLIGTFHGYLIAYLQIPAFIVTLGGMFVWRGATFLVHRGETIAPLDQTFTLIGGGPYGSVGATASWVLAAIACIGIFFMIRTSRMNRARFGFPMRPMWAEWTVGLITAAIVIAATWVMDLYYWPIGIVKSYAAANNIEIPEGGLNISHGWAIPVLLALVVCLVMTFIATRTKFGRYIYAMGGNPEAAELAGINTKRLTMFIFSLMGFLVGLSACVASARLQSATGNLGTFDELFVIAAAVIGGTSLSGGSGTIYGALIGALVMQSLNSGMVLIGFDAGMQQMVVGLVLVLAVFVDTMYRRRAK